MQIGTIGLNHKSAPIAIRELFSEALLHLHNNIDWDGHSLVPFSTCNRSEIIFSSDDVSQTHIDLLAAFRRKMPLDFEHHLYSYFGRDSFLHLTRVVTGLDSALVGECEIQRQVKKAYEKEKQNRSLSRDLHYAFQKSFKIAKSMRSRFRMERWGMDLPHIIWDVLSGNNVQRVLFVGYSDINRKIMAYLQKKEIEFDLYTRCLDAPYRVIASLEYLNTYDAVICGTTSQEYILTKERNAVPNVLLDLGVPRNIDPTLGEGRVLMNIDELSQSVQEKKTQVATEIVMCGKAIEHLVDRHKMLYFLNSKPQVRKLYQVI